MRVRVPIIDCRTCQVPYVLRLNLLGGEYVWMPDCRHKGQHELTEDHGTLVVADDAVIAP